MASSSDAMSDTLQWLHECASSSNRIAKIAARHLSADRSFFDEVATELSVSSGNFRLYERNCRLQELGGDIKESGPTVVAKVLARELSVHVSRHTTLEMSDNNYPPGGRQYRVHEVLRLNKGRALKWRQIYDILQLRL